MPEQSKNNLNSEYTLDKMVYLPRTNAGNGTLLRGTVEISPDKAGWTEAGQFSWERSNKEKEFTFPEGCEKSRYVKIKVTKAVGDFGSGRELFVFKKSS